MITAKDCYAKYGNPDKTFEFKWMTLWDVPTELEIGVIPKKLYCNKDIVPYLTAAFTNLINRGYVEELKTWDGCFNVRFIRGSKTQMSIHSWGTAIDVNAAWNGLGKEPVLSAGFVKCFTDVGFDWGGLWKRKDGMHFQLASIVPLPGIKVPVIASKPKPPTTVKPALARAPQPTTKPWWNFWG